MFFRLKKRPLTALQIEVSSRCTRQCGLCPRSALSNKWQNIDMSDELWKKATPAFGQAEYVYLQGWGEPLCHPALPQMAREAKKSGAKVGFTTNGDLLESAADWILREGVDLLTVSVAGDKKHHARLRDGSEIEKIMDGIEKLTRGARETKNRIKVQISYLLTRENAGDLPSILKRGAKAGVKDFFATHLDVTPTRHLLDQSAFDENGLRSEVGKHLREAETASGKLRVKFRGPTTEPEERLACALNPLKFAFVTADGRVGPCVNLLFPVEGAIPRQDFSVMREIKQTSYGHLADQNLTEILAGKTRKVFTANFIMRLNAEARFHRRIRSADAWQALAKLGEFEKERDEILRAYPFPEVCAGCHKIMGW